MRDASDKVAEKIKAPHFVFNKFPFPATVLFVR
jgi:hypothetical protein